MNFKSSELSLALIPPPVANLWFNFGRNRIKSSLQTEISPLLPRPFFKKTKPPIDFPTFPSYRTLSTGTSHTQTLVHIPEICRCVVRSNRSRTHTHTHETLKNFCFSMRCLGLVQELKKILKKMVHMDIGDVRTLNEMNVVFKWSKASYSKMRERVFFSARNHKNSRIKWKAKRSRRNEKRYPKKDKKKNNKKPRLLLS